MDARDSIFTDPAITDLDGPRAAEMLRTVEEGRPVLDCCDPGRRGWDWHDRHCIVTRRDTAQRRCWYAADDAARYSLRREHAWEMSHARREELIAFLTMLHIIDGIEGSPVDAADAMIGAAAVAAIFGMCGEETPEREEWWRRTPADQEAHRRRMFHHAWGHAQYHRNVTADHDFTRGAFTPIPDVLVCNVTRAA